MSNPSNPRAASLTRSNGEDSGRGRGALLPILRRHMAASRREVWGQGSMRPAWSADRPFRGTTGAKVSGRGPGACRGPDLRRPGLQKQGVQPPFRRCWYNRDVPKKDLVRTAVFHAFRRVASLKFAGHIGGTEGECEVLSFEGALVS